MKKILLLNPPSNNKYYIRDYYCSHISKGHYYWPPLDLLVLSGILKDHFYLYVLDALIQKMSYIEICNFIREIAPDFIISVTGAVSWNLDMAFLSKIKKLSDSAIIVSGDYPLAQPKEVIENYPFIDAILLDFTDSEIINFMHGEKLHSLKNVFTKFDKDNPFAVVNKNSTVTLKSFNIPVPLYNLFPLRLYHLPHIYHHPFVTIMTDFGCPFSCIFCPFERIRYKTRNIDNIAEDLECISYLDIKEIWVRDQGFGSVMEHALDFCKVLKSINKDFSWSCEMRVDAADEILLKTMKDSGCHTVMFGVETSNEKILSKYKRGITIDQIKKGFGAARKVGLRTLAHFMLGLSGEDVDSQIKLIDFCLSLNPDYASFNIAAPAWNTSFREEAINNDWLVDDEIEIDSSCSYPILETDTLKPSEVWQIRKLALRKFYLRPSYILNQLKNIKTYYQLRMLLKEGLYLINTLNRKI